MPDLGRSSASAKTKYQELLTAIASVTSRRNVLGVIALKRPIAISHSDDNRDGSTEQEQRPREIYRSGREKEGDNTKRDRCAKPAAKPFLLDKLFQERLGPTAAK